MIQLIAASTEWALCTAKPVAFLNTAIELFWKMVDILMMCPRNAKEAHAGISLEYMLTMCIVLPLSIYLVKGKPTMFCGLGD